MTTEIQGLNYQVMECEMITNEELDAIEARADKATEGPWDVHTWYRVMDGDDEIVIAVKKDTEATTEDLALLDSSRTDVPKLVKEVRRLRKALEWYCNSELPVAEVLIDAGHRAREALGVRDE